MRLELDVTLELGSLRRAVHAVLEGRIIGLAGGSGSGKTSLLHAIAGLPAPVRGRVALNDRVLCDEHRRWRMPPHQRGVAVAFQDGRLFPHLTVRHNLTYGWNHLPATQRRIEPLEVIRWLKLESLLDRRPRHLSGGERQRVTLGRAILAHPRLLLLDEPTTALDATLRERVLELLEYLRDKWAMPMVLVSHQSEELTRLADVVLNLRQEQANGADFSLWHGSCTTPAMNIRCQTPQWPAGAHADNQPLARVG